MRERHHALADRSAHATKPGPTAVPPCNVSLVARKEGSAPCVGGQSFGCDSANHIWVDKGCRADLRCGDGTVVQCALPSPTSRHAKLWLEFNYILTQPPIGDQGWTRQRLRCSCAADAVVREKQKVRLVCEAVGGRPMHQAGVVVRARAELGRYNSLLAEAVHEDGSLVDALVDQHDGFDALYDTRGDSVHPNDIGSDKIARVWHKALARVLLGSPAPPRPHTNWTVMPLGDSITRNYYRARLWKLLSEDERFAGRVEFVGRSRFTTMEAEHVRAAASSSGFSEAHEGLTRINTSELSQQLRAIFNHRCPTAVMLHVGTNDFVLSPETCNATTSALNTLHMVRWIRGTCPKSRLLLAKIIPFHAADKLGWYEGCVGGFGEGGDGGREGGRTDASTNRRVVAAGDPVEDDEDGGSVTWVPLSQATDTEETPPPLRKAPRIAQNAWRGATCKASEYARCAPASGRRPDPSSPTPSKGRGETRDDAPTKGGVGGGHEAAHHEVALRAPMRRAETRSGANQSGAAALTRTQQQRHHHYHQCKPGRSAETVERALRAAALSRQAATSTVRVAQCVVGLWESGKVNEADTKRGVSILDPRGHNAWREWASTLRLSHNISTDWYLRVDMRRGAIRPRRSGGKEAAMHFADPSLVDPLSYPSCNDSSVMGSLPRSKLEPMVAALRPVSLRTEPLDCYCRAHDCTCDALRSPNSLGTEAAGIPAWWEQMLKVRACFSDVAAYERAGGFRYDYVGKLRTDYEPMRNGLSPLAFAAAVRMQQAQEEAQHIVAANWGAYYVNIDWMWLAPRPLARAAFSIANASCEWLRCVQSKVPPRALSPRGGGSPSQNGRGDGEWDQFRWRGSLPWHHALTDGLLTEWWLTHGAPFAALITDPTSHLQSGGTTHNDVCVYASENQGVVGLGHRGHAPLCPPSGTGSFGGPRASPALHA
jgi:lysophospholipase L1-like esterase